MNLKGSRHAAEPGANKGEQGKEDGEGERKRWPHDAIAPIPIHPHDRSFFLALSLPWRRRRVLVH